MIVFAPNDTIGKVVDNNGSLVVGQTIIKVIK